MDKRTHEIRDPIHVFVRLDSDERKILDTRSLQRLRHIHQLALSFLIYPGATHRRFEHSLGVMELAGRIFDRVTSPEAVTDEIRELIPEITRTKDHDYWRRVLRMAALCHDIGHLPFSHAAEKELLPESWDHERITGVLLNSPEMRKIFHDITPPLREMDVLKLALGPNKAREQIFTIWETILSEIITSDVFGADRMDYLLRDSYHAGVSYGRFDHIRLIDTMRILCPPPTDDQSSEPSLGVEDGGLRSAEALLLARYFMYSQLYLHPIRRIYDIHLRDFLKAWLPGGLFPISYEKHLSYTDNEVMAAILSSALKKSATAHEHARRIMMREHFRVLYERNPDDVKTNPDAASAVSESAQEVFGKEAVRFARYPGKGTSYDFPVQQRDGRIASSLSVSEVLQRIPVPAFDCVFIEPTLHAKAMKWLAENLERVIRPTKEE